MKAYIIDSIVCHNALIYAQNVVVALEKYAHECGYSSIDELKDECRNTFGTPSLSDAMCIDIERISLPLTNHHKKIHTLY